jgi:hypothetical protein
MDQSLGRYHYESSKQWDIIYSISVLHHQQELYNKTIEAVLHSEIARE